MSFWAAPIKPDIKIVIAPHRATNQEMPGLQYKKMLQRISKKTPAVTIVAACIKAETGVGPSIASGNQVCRPICADLTTAAITKKNAIISTTRLSQNGISNCSTSNYKVLKTKKVKAMPVKKNKSPTLLTKKALVADLAAWARTVQKPISK